MASYVGIMLTLAMIFMRCKCSDISEAEIDQLLKKLNKRAVKSIESPDGDIIDCVDINKQPAFDHPLLKNHTAKMIPSFYAEISSNTEKKSNLVSQLWTINGRCPENTVPIRRTRKEDVLREKSIKRFGKKDPTSNQASRNHATVRAQGRGFHGGKANINVWTPYIQEHEEFSLAQIWLSAAGSTIHENSIEAGWQAYPEFYGDNSPRFFVFWTSDGYGGERGCYNLWCEGFVKTGDHFVPGMALNATSIYGGEQEELIVYIRKDTASRDWWLVINDGLVGYWPEAIVPLLAQGAEDVIWGGEIMDRKTGGHHTSTHMGSGHFPQQGFKMAAYFRNLEILDEHNIRRKPTILPATLTNANCYNILPNRHKIWGNYFFYGGPGRNPHCP